MTLPFRHKQITELYFLWPYIEWLERACSRSHRPLLQRFQPTAVTVQFKILCWLLLVCSFQFYFSATVDHLSGCWALITFRVIRRRREIYTGHAPLCVCVSVCLSFAAFPHYCTDLDVTWKNGRECPRVVDYWADIQSVHGFRCYDIPEREMSASACTRSMHGFPSVNLNFQDKWVSE